MKLKAIINFQEFNQPKRLNHILLGIHLQEKYRLITFKNTFKNSKILKT